jgi:aminopeptidase YwaD
MKKLSIFLSLVFLLFAAGVNAQQGADSIRQNAEIEKLKAQIEADSINQALLKADTLKHNQSTAEKNMIMGHIAMLTGEHMHGRGYVRNGRDTAEFYILKRFKDYKLQPVTKDGRYTQPYAFPVNTFPGKMALVVDDEQLTPGSQFLIDASSASFSGKNLAIKKINLNKINDKVAWQETVSSFDTAHAYYFEHVDSFCSTVMQIRKSHFLALLPAGCYIVPEEGKLTWTVSRQQYPGTLFYVRESALPKKLKKVTVNTDALLLPRARSENVVACVPGTVKDTFIAFTAHYDHLGMMGENTVFPGASDNASGTAMLLYLASYFSAHPQHYSILFIAFAGEEAALKGSDFFVQNPMVPLKSIKFLTNIDIMGDATDGVTVVNATEFPKEFGMLQEINDKQKYVPAINSRGRAANSDHYYFTEAGVPSFFIYSVGGRGFYHDVFDKAKEVTLNNVDGVAKLLIDFVAAIN